MALQAAGFGALLEGETPTAADIAVRARLTPERAEAAAARLLGRETLLATDHGHIEGIAGLTVRPTRHQLTMGGTSIHTWCAFDSVGIPAALGVDATARTSCGHCGDAIEVDFDHGVTDSQDLWGWIPALDPTERSLITNFCSKADLFCSREHLDAWYETAGHPAGDPATMDELLAMGRATWEHCVA